MSFDNCDFGGWEGGFWGVGVVGGGANLMGRGAEFLIGGANFGEFGAILRIGVRIRAMCVRNSRDRVRI